MKMFLDVDDFVSDLEKSYHLLTNGSSAMNGCRQNESKYLIKTSQ